MSCNHGYLAKDASFFYHCRVQDQHDLGREEKKACLGDVPATKQGFGKLVGDFLTAVQTYQLEFDAEDVRSHVFLLYWLFIYPCHCLVPICILVYIYIYIYIYIYLCMLFVVFLHVCVCCLLDFCIYSHVN
jgi:hypothetical protein